MATSIGFPKIGNDLIKFVKGSTAHSSACFGTNANLMIFAAAWAFNEGVEIDENAKVDCKPDPIGWDTFQNNKLDKICLAIGIAHVGAEGVKFSNDKEGSIASSRLANIIENYASEGFRLLVQLYQVSDGSSFFDDLLEKLISEN